LVFLSQIKILIMKTKEQRIQEKLQKEYIDYINGDRRPTRSVRKSIKRQEEDEFNFRIMLFTWKDDFDSFEIGL
jgi:hypothetical protein